MRPEILRAALALLLTPVAAAPAGDADFGEGLERLAALGLPPMEGATWIRKPKDIRESFPESYEFRETGVRLQGSMWKLSGDPPRIIGFGTAEETETAEKPAEDEPEAEKGAGLLEKMLRNHAARNPRRKREPKPGPDVAEDAMRLAEAFAKPDVREEIQQQMEYGRRDLPARCLIFAAQLHAAGETAAANRLANAIFATIPDKEALIDAAVSHFATAEYDTATTGFFEHRNWGKYRKELQAILAKYPRGWDHAGAVAMLMPGLESRVAGERPPAPSLPGIEVKPEALAAVEALLGPPASSGSSDENLARSHGIDLSEIPAAHRQQYLAMLRQHGMGGMSGSSDGTWLLTETETETDPADPVGKLKAMGMDGLIALAAVATDETLVPLPNSVGRRSYYYSSGGQSAEELALQKFGSMSRPKTRGEIATELLKATIPGGTDDFSEIDAATVAELAVDFWKRHQTSSKIEIAARLLTDGDDSQKSEAAGYLAGHEDPNAHAAFEKAVLAADDLASFSSHVAAYLDKRKAAAKPFFDAYSKALIEFVDSVDESEIDYSIRSAGGVDKYLKTLSVKVGATSLKELVDAALESEELAEIAGLAEAMGDTPMEECLTVVGEAVAEATPAQAGAFYQLLLQLAYRGQRELAGDDPPAPVTLTGDALDLWRPLLSRSDPLPAEGQFSQWAKAYGGATSGDGAALVLEVSAFPASGIEFNGYGNIHESLAVVAPFVRSRVEAWIDGKKPEPWPDATNVDDARKEEIAGKLAVLPAAEILPFARSLSDDERLALVDLIGEFDGEENPAPSGLLELRATVVARRAYNATMPHDDKLLDQLGIQDGYVLSPEGLTAVGERLAREAGDFSGTRILFMEAPMGMGRIATATRATEPEEIGFNRPLAVTRWFDHYGNPDTLAMLAIHNAADFWTVKDGELVKLESRQPVDEAFKTSFESKAATLPYISLEVITRDDAEKFTNR